MSIIGECPYADCDESFLLWEQPERMPALERHVCEKCGRAVWTQHSRVDPWSMTEGDFLATHDIDEATKTVTRRADQERKP